MKLCLAFFDFCSLAKVYRFRAINYYCNCFEKMVTMIDGKCTKLISNHPGFIQVDVKFLLQRDKEDNTIFDSFAKRLN